jgi:transposase
MFEVQLGLRAMSITVHKSMSNADAPVRRFEVFTGAGRRRTWSDEERAAILEESYAGFDSVSGVARRHSLSPSQLFAWRRAARLPLQGSDLFVPAILEEPVKDLVQTESKPRRPQLSRRRGKAVGLIEVEIDGIVVRVGHGAEAATVTAILRALKGAS